MFSIKAIWTKGDIVDESLTKKAVYFEIWKEGRYDIENQFLFFDDDDYDDNNDDDKDDNGDDCDCVEGDDGVRTLWCKWWWWQ